MDVCIYACLYVSLCADKPIILEEFSSPDVTVRDVVIVVCIYACLYVSLSVCADKPVIFEEFSSSDVTVRMC